ncbi:adenylate/guanylate cyclase domain-containing protein [Patulibacter sp.]|uniref:adenylate/guanylate cyclase domain-containing protein n=1 Tax=Patulibacter sp. TaxID=1912859 RepID=UPI00271D7D12|nr:adenylate/guanylate cyclase domain-containing protein [Patulibacter sp.]MDO9410602.1 adenylate/guanylate cyclase domain-containing protein [Patulibacter sp.]
MRGRLPTSPATPAPADPDPPPSRASRGLRKLTAGLRSVVSSDGVVVRVMGAVLVVVLLIANFVSAGIVMLLVVFVVPGRATDAARDALGSNAWFLLGFMLVVIPWVLWWSERAMRSVTRWIGSDREARPEEVHQLLRAPVRVLVMLGAAWTLAAILFSLFNIWKSDADGPTTALLALRVYLVTQLTGLTMAAFGYLVTERLLRPVAAIALQAGGLDRAVLPGVTRRQLLGWATATGAPVVGLVVIGVLVTIDDKGVTADRMALAMIVLGGVALVFGLAVELLAARAVADPVRTVRRGMEAVRRGGLDARIPVYDASDMGRLQDGFNRMATDLQDRARLRDLFGRHVGEDVARAALDQEVRLGGEAREVCALFVDIVGSTSLAAEHSPDEVVAALNRFFAVVVETVDEHGGWVNKFQGDAALVVFGAPVAQDDAPDRALASARVLAERLRERVPELRAGVGVSGGPAVAGYVGAEQRLEYTVIGDPINEAARLTEVAKETSSMTAASGRLVARASAAERRRWVLEHEETLRGRAEATDVMVPRPDGD